MKRKFTLLTILMLASTTLVTARVRNRDLKSGKKQIRSIVLVPMQLSLARLTMKGPEPMMQEARDAELPLQLEIEAALRSRGYRLDMHSLSPETLAQDPDQRYAVDNLQKKFDAQLPLLRHHSKDVRKGRFTVGDDVLQLPLSDQIDALLFVRVHGQLLTENKKAFGTFVAGARSDTTTFDFGLIDAKTGTVLYYAKSTLTDNLIIDADQIANGIALAFSDLPVTGMHLAPPYLALSSNNEHLPNQPASKLQSLQPSMPQSRVHRRNDSISPASCSITSCFKRSRLNIRELQR